MGIELYPVVEGYDQLYFFIRPTVVDWKALPRKLDELDRVAEQLAVSTLSSFINFTRDEAPWGTEQIEEIEQQGELIDGMWYYEGQPMYSVQPQWFSPEQGLITVRSLLDYLLDYLWERQEKQDLLSDDEQDIGSEIEEVEGVISELDQMAKILIKAKREAKGFRLSLCI
jgi:hypothetical protein